MVDDWWIYQYILLQICRMYSTSHEVTWWFILPCKNYCHILLPRFRHHFTTILFPIIHGWRTGWRLPKSIQKSLQIQTHCAAIHGKWLSKSMDLIPSCSINPITLSRSMDWSWLTLNQWHNGPIINSCCFCRSPFTNFESWLIKVSDEIFLKW